MHQFYGEFFSINCFSRRLFLLNYLSKPQLQLKSHHICNFEFANQSTLRTTWRGSLSTWRLLLPAEIALLQEDLVSGITKWWPETPLTGRRAQICAQTIFRNCDAEVSIYGKKGKATINGLLWARFTITSVTMQSTEAVRCPVLTKLSWTTVILISASIAVESSIRNGFITGRLNNCCGET